jgi:hypothetical protein
MDDPDEGIDFATLHNILYYIYTGTVNLHVRSKKDVKIPVPEGYPEEPDPYRLYRNADKFLLPSLKGHCYKYLKYGLTPENVADRLFHEECEHHEALQTLYLEYAIANFGKVKITEGWEAAVCNENEASVSVIRYRLQRLYTISQKFISQFFRVNRRK